MTKRFLKLVSVVMALCFFMGVMPVFASAKEYAISAPETYFVTEFSPETQLPMQYGGTAIQFYSNGAEVDTTRYFYNQLTATQKSLYDQIKAAGMVQNVVIDMTNVNITGTGGAQAEAQNALVSNITANVKMAISALNEDYPLFFWMDGFSWNNAYLSFSVSGGVYTAKLTSLNVVINISSTHFTDYNDVQNKYNAVIEKLNSIKINGINRHEKLKSINDYLADNLVYDTTLSKSNIFDVYGALVNGLCVCEGYAEAMKLLCDREGIPCITVVGTGNGGAHKWNNVQMDDGEWYLIDTTWNDQSSSTFYSYFLIGSNTKAPYFSDSTTPDSIVHIPTGTLFTGATPLSYPVLSDDTYSVGVLQINAPDIAVLKTKNVIIVGKGQTSFLYEFISDSSLGYTKEKTGAGTTGSSLTLGDGVSEETYLVAMRGDVNKSNTVNSDDYTLLTQICNTTSAVEKDSAQFYAGDMTQDGAIDGFDVIAQELYEKDMLVFD